MRSVDDLLRKNLKAFGERDAEKRRMAISTIWESDGVFIDPDSLHIGAEAIDNAVQHLLLKFADFVFSELGLPDSPSGIGRLAWGFGPAGESRRSQASTWLSSRLPRLRRSTHSSILPRGGHKTSETRSSRQHGAGKSN
jgi:hypothetical protein